MTFLPALLQRPQLTAVSVHAMFDVAVSLSFMGMYVFLESSTCFFRHMNRQISVSECVLVPFLPLFACVMLAWAKNYYRCREGQSALPQIMCSFRNCSCVGNWLYEHLPFTTRLELIVLLHTGQRRRTALCHSLTYSDTRWPERWSFRSFSVNAYLYGLTSNAARLFTLSPFLRCNNH